MGSAGLIVPPTIMVIGFAAGLYATAHFLRALRFWLMLQDPQLSLKKTFLIFQSTSVLGSAIPLLLVEFLRWWVLTWSVGRKRVVAVISFSLFARLLDIVVAAGPLLINTILVYHGPRADANGTGLFLFLVMILGLICSARQAVAFIKKVVIARGRSRLSVLLVRGLNQVEQGFFSFLDQPLSTLVFQVLLTVLIWSFDVLAFHQVAAAFAVQPMNGWDSASLWSAHSFGRLFGNNADTLASPALWATLILPQVVLTGGLLLILLYSYLTKEKSC